MIILMGILFIVFGIIVLNFIILSKNKNNDINENYEIEEPIKKFDD